jgi:hypothetical protein
MIDGEFDTIKSLERRDDREWNGDKGWLWSLGGGKKTMGPRPVTSLALIISSFICDRPTPKQKPIYVRYLFEP